MPEPQTEPAFDQPLARSVTPVEVGPIDLPDAPEVLASALRDRILSGELAEGVLLPPERLLVEQTRLSRATVRESLRILQLQGLIVRRPGRSGGSVVARPATQDVIRWLDVYLQGRRLETGVLLEVREIIEPWCAALAAERRTDEDLAALDTWNAELKQRVDDLPAYLKINVAWHTAVAEASHNEILAALMHALSLGVLRQTSSERFNTAEVRATAVRAHQLITDAIRARDAETAQRRMERHVRGFAGALLQSEATATPEPA